LDTIQLKTAKSDQKTSTVYKAM